MLKDHDFNDLESFSLKIRQGALSIAEEIAGCIPK